MPDVKIGNIEKDEIFFRLFDKRYPKFKWMVEKYAFNDMIMIEELRKEKNKHLLINRLSHIWLMKIPDSINIKNNQPGVCDLLFLIDNDDFLFERKE